MDTIVSQTTNLSILNRKRKFKEDIKMIFPNRSKFQSSCFRQSFSLPNSIIYYITKNPSTPKLYQKLIKSCKYFFIKNSILVIPEIFFNKAEWKIWKNDEFKKFNLKNTLSKFWITEDLHIFTKNANEKFIASSIIPKLYSCDSGCFDLLNIENQSFSYKELLFLSSNVKYLNFEKCAIKKENGSILQLEELLQIFPKLTHFTYKPILSTPTITAKTFKELLKIPHFIKIHYFYMWCIPDNFDIESFYAYMKKNKLTKIRFYFDGISAAYKARIETIIDEIIETQNHDFKVPYIYFEGLVEEKLQKLRYRFHGI